MDHEKKGSIGRLYRQGCLMLVFEKIFITFDSMVEALAEKERFEESLRIARSEERQREGIIALCMY